MRMEIQGVRGLALVLVLLCHADVPFAAGGFVGLDVFFILSGFLITGLIVTELERTGTLSLSRFYGRRAKRLLPLAALVLGVVVVFSYAVFPPVRAGEVASDVIAASLYFVNWHFIAESVDYFAFEGGGVSPVQHYWSLSVEEQFYLVWPPLLLVASAYARRRGRTGRAAMLVVVSALTLALLVYGMRLTAEDTRIAYLSTFARGWELALGGVLALVLPRVLRMPRALTALLSGGGLVVLLAAALAFDGETTPYPGWQALIPTCATLAIIVAGSAPQMAAPVRVLALAPMQYLGKISYAWYLWHWPALIFAAELAGRSLTVSEKLAVSLASGVPAILSHYAIEEPFRHSKALLRPPRRALALGAACSATIVVMGAMLSAAQPSVEVASTAIAIGAAASPDELQTRADALRPPPDEANADRGKAWYDGCLADGAKTRSDKCTYGDTSSKTTVVLFGDSHAIQYAPAMIKLAEQHRWRLVVLTRAACVMADVNFQPTCDAWRRNTFARIAREKPGLIVTTNATTQRQFRVKVGDKRLSRTDSQPLLDAGYARTLRKLRATGAKVVAIRDQTRAPLVPHDCVAEHIKRLERCVFPFRRPPWMDFVGRGARRVKGIKVIDPRTVLCPRRRCPSVIGNVLVYRDTYHLSATFAETLAPWLDKRLPRPR
jgi:peptidoglycan/LPS O-acetylase OafA/YrhL